ncbi:MAG TPA: hypothetical protein VLA93_19955 [Pyrinomonadaceae bacterium]|nr:hypothetical protein [Pyrinomonadaceae bacterium]
MEEQPVADGHLEDSLRQEIEHYFEGRLSAIKQEIALLQSQFNESLATLFDRQGDVQTEGSLSTSIAEYLRAAHERGVEFAAAESSRAKASSDMAIVKAAISEIGEQQSQADILKTLINRGSSFAPRIAFFVIKGDRASGWRARGFEGSVGDQAIQDIAMSLNAETVIGNVAKSLTTWSGGPGSHPDDYMLVDRLGEEPPQRIVAIPLIVRKRAVAVLYADSAGLDSESINLEALETLVAVSGMAVELLSVARAPRREEQPPAAVAPEAAPAYTPEREYEEPPQAQSPEAMADTLRPSYVEAEAAPPVEAPVQPEMAEPAYEGSMTMEPEPAPEVQEQAPSPTRRRYGQDQDLPVEVASDEERRLHNDARRFARLLISEIKLYNEQKVAEGRSQHDLYDRLREYIDRSREMYDKRVRAEVAARYDYFHGELVNTLAEGDVSKLGSNYPGATVTA